MIHLIRGDWCVTWSAGSTLCGRREDGDGCAPILWYINVYSPDAAAVPCPSCVEALTPMDYLNCVDL